MWRRIQILCLILLPILGACKTTERHAQRETAQRQEAARRQEYHEHKKAVRAHLNKQDKQTKKRIKKTVKNQRKENRENAPKGKAPVPCPKK